VIPRLTPNRRQVIPLLNMSMKMRDIMRIVEAAPLQNAKATQLQALIRGVKAGKLLVHVRVNDGTDFKWGIQPSAGDFLRSTESWQWAEEEHGEGPELTFFADDFGWVTSTSLGDQVRKQAIFVRKNDSIVQYVGEDKVKTASGAVIRYTQSEIADYDNPNFRDVPAGVEPGDWFTNVAQDVLAVIEVPTLIAALTGQPIARP